MWTFLQLFFNRKSSNLGTSNYLFFISPRMLQSVRRHSAITLTVTINDMQQIHPVDISPIKAQSELIDYCLRGFYRVLVKISASNRNEYQVYFLGVEASGT